MLADVVWGAALIGLLLFLGAWLLGPGRVAVAAHRRLTPALRDQPVAARLVLGALLLGLVWWHPVPWTGRVITLLILAVAALAWPEVVRRQVIEQPAVRPS